MIIETVKNREESCHAMQKRYEEERLTRGREQKMDPGAILTQQPMRWFIRRCGVGIVAMAALVAALCGLISLFLGLAG